MISDIEQESRTERKKRRTHNALIEATLTMISTHGIGKFTMQDVTDSADVSPATIYNYFNTKEELISSAMETVMGQLALKIEETTERFPDPIFAFPYGLSTVLNVMAFDERFLWLHQHPDALAGSIDRCFGRYAKYDMQLGVDAGKYHVDDFDVTWRLISWGVVGVSLGVSQGDLPKEVLNTTVINALKMVGLEQQAAIELFGKLPPPIEIG